jgi:predicted permease
MRNIWQDIRHGLKLLVKNPGFTAVAIFSLALGIGLNSVIFCLVDQIILQPLPVDRPEELALFSIRGERGVLSRSLAYPEYLELRSQCRSFSGILGMQRRGTILTDGETSELVPAEAVTGNYFTVLGLKPYRGQFFRDGEYGKGNERVAVLSYGLWQRRFGGDPGIIGKAVALSRRQVTILGITPKNFNGAQRPFSNTNVWFPAEQFGVILAGPRAEQFDLLGRVAAGVSIEGAQAEVDTVARRLVPSNPAAGRFLGATVKFEREDHLERLGNLGILVMITAGLILLIACVNVSNLLLARSQVRRKEIAIRLALGSSRVRLTRQLLTESLVLSLVASATGLLLTRWAVQALPAFLPPMPMQLFPEINPEARVVGFAIGMAFITTLIFALIPSVHASRFRLVSLLNESADTSKGGRRYLGRNVLVVGQLCISLVMLTQSGLLVKSFLRGLQADVGFEKKNMLLAQFALGMNGYDANQAGAFLQTLQERTLALPGVKQVSLARRIPLSLMGGGASQQVTIPSEKTRRK